MLQYIPISSLGVLVVVIFQTHCSVANVAVPGLSYLPPARESTLIEVGQPAISVPAAGPTLSTSFPAFEIPKSASGTSGQQETSSSSQTDSISGIMEEGVLPRTSCTEFCPFDYSPVCGSDGITYTNNCTFSIAACKNSNLVFEGDGPCVPTVSSDSPPEFTPLPPSPSAPSLSVPTPTRAPVVIPFPSDSPDFQAAPEGGVVPFPPSFASLGSYTTPDENLSGSSECPEACLKIYQPVCGTDGVTYSNKCALYVAACKGRADGQNIAVAFEGICGDSLSDEPLTESVDVKGEALAPTLPIGTSASCDKRCTKIFIPVCGSDGNTYNSICVLEVASCESVSLNGSPITLQSEGTCGDPISDKPLTEPVDAKGEALVPALPTGASASCDKQCTKIFIPVCGSDGNTYNSICLLEVASCESENLNGSPITLQYEGTCGDVMSDKPLTESVDVKGEALVPALPVGVSSSCDKQCTKIFIPVCGSDGNTYNSICLLEVASCESVNLNGSPITLQYESTCVSAIPDRTGVSSTATVPDESLGSLVASTGTSGDGVDSVGTTDSLSVESAPCPEACTKIYLPVCGSDGQTYNNECMLKITACKSRSAGGINLYKEFDGPCVAALPRGPVCDEMCDKTFLPVCGSDGETYNNICLLNVADCLNPFTTITLASEGPCESTSAAGLSTDPRPSVDTSPSQSAIDSLTTGVHNTNVHTEDEVFKTSLPSIYDDSSAESTSSEEIYSLYIHDPMCSEVIFYHGIILVTKCVTRPISPIVKAMARPTATSVDWTLPIVLTLSPEYPWVKIDSQ